MKPLRFAFVLLCGAFSWLGWLELSEKRAVSGLLSAVSEASGKKSLNVEFNRKYEPRARICEILLGEMASDIWLIRTVVDVTAAHMTDGGLRHIRALRNLRTLRLDGTDVSDAGLVYLEHLKELRHLYIAGTPITPGGIAKLKRSLPHLVVHSGL